MSSTLLVFYANHKIKFFVAVSLSLAINLFLIKTLFESDMDEKMYVNKLYSRTFFSSQGNNTSNINNRKKQKYLLQLFRTNTKMEYVNQLISQHDFFQLR